MEIHQFLPGASLGDAITHFAEELQDMFLSSGIAEKSIIFSDFKHTPPVYQEKFSPFESYKGDAKNLVMYHFGIGSDITEYFKKLPDKRMLVYHNITPSKYFRLINPEKVAVLEQGKEQIKDLVGSVDLALGVSRYNTKELHEIGFENTDVLPLILDDAYFSQKPEMNIIKSYANNQTKILAVGRIAPNKRLEDVVKVFYYYQKLIDPDSWLFLVGSYGGTLNYYMYIRSLVEALNLKNVIFTGHVSQEQLIAYYRTADMFLTMSDHEGFCIPVLEAFYFNLPVVAYASSAIPETVGNAGVLIKKKDYPAVAEMIHEVHTCPDIANALRHRGKEKLKQFTKETVKVQFESILKKLGYDCKK